ncbi:hypothetical protein AMJ80_11890 [bacterium SM23_31]|nr:MAG: hypothetical protein AMJ80_11890 [bacterium SM23_31]
MNQTRKVLSLISILFFVFLIAGCSKNPIGLDNPILEDNENSISFKGNVNSTESLTGVQTLNSTASGAVDDIKLIGGGSEKVYEDGTYVDRWAIDPPNGGGTFASIYDTDRGSDVIEFSNNGTDTWFILDAGNGMPWNNSTMFTLQWWMKNNTGFEILVNVIAIDEKYQPVYMFLYYTSKDGDDGYTSSGHYGLPMVHHGLGSNIVDGAWRLFERNLLDDLKDSLPNFIGIDMVRYFFIRGKDTPAPPPPPPPPPPTPEMPSTADAHSIGFWKNNIRKAVQGKLNGVQVPFDTLEHYLSKINGFALSPFNSSELTDLQAAHNTLSAKGSNAILLLKKQLLTAEFNFMNGAYIGGNNLSAIDFLTDAENMILNPGTRSEILDLKDKLDAFNNGESIIPLP